MKNKIVPILAAIASIFIFGGCEKDDICTDAVTPSLIIKFYDDTSLSDIKTVTELRVYGVGNEDEMIIDRVSNLDSILVPLKTLENTTSFVLISNSGDDDTTGEEVGNIDTISFNYVTNEIYVSRACGYKVNYSQLSSTITDDGDNWITSISIENNEVVDENQAHVSIYH
ncbi:hypothetical protein NBRC110019_22830 [Neptunitalea chrysea]|uniref:Lipoprotein n=1 Tax=Neptunitalea chrysea TaxID=1647581 RepID=A0A9W6EWN2_9FLAO|nr:DUF6452 family protein [Neptunitalea chrysea]GLB53243.1 hypothetical protein NBRC110019_22830 [Neptunitalea chrysea]